MRLAVLGSNSETGYSGGRYHAMMLAVCAARAGLDVHYLTNTRPQFAAELERLTPAGLTWHVAGDLAFDPAAIAETGAFDYLVVIPTGVREPRFYDTARLLTGALAARPVLVNFESANWFNATAPQAKDPGPWEDWRRVVADGGLVLSSARESDRYARPFYRPGAESVAFEVWPPAINSELAEACSSGHAETPKDGSVLAFVRPTDAHKGAQTLLQLDPGLFAARVLTIVFGKGVDAATVIAVRRHLAAAGGRVEALEQIDDAKKFALIAKAGALLFPSSFEGFGYPPVEAAYLGTEVACYDVPVLRESLGTLGHFAPLGDHVALGRALAAALDQSPRKERLRAQVEQLVGLDAASLRLLEILTRNRRRVRPARRGTGRVILVEGDAGPVAGADPMRPLPVARALMARRTPEGLILVRLRFATEERLARLELDSQPALAFWSAGPAVLGHWHWTVDLVLEADALRAERALVAYDDKGAALQHLRFMVMAAQDAPPVAVEGLGVHADAGVVRLDYRAKACQGGLLGPAAGGVARGFACSRSGTLQIALEPGAAPYDQRLLLVDEVGPVGLFHLLPAEPVTVAADAAPRQSIEGQDEVAVARLTNKDWLNGVASFFDKDAPASVLLIDETPLAADLQPGGILRTPSGRLRRIERVEAASPYCKISLNDWISPLLDGYPGRLTLCRSGPANAVATLRPAGPDDHLWQNGVLDAAPYRGLAIRLERQTAGSVRQGDMLLFTGGRRMVAATSGSGDMLTLWLDRPLGSAAQRQLGKGLVILSAADADATMLTLDRSPEDGFEAGVEVGADEPPRRLRLAAGPLVAELQPGCLIACGIDLRRRILSVEHTPRGAIVTLEHGIERRQLAGRAALWTRLDWLCGGNAMTALYPNPELSPEPDLLDAYLRRARAAVPFDPSAAATDGPPRVLMLSMVGHAPADQGNTTWTRNLVRHVLSLGFDVDLLVENHVDLAASFAEFSDRVRIVQTPWPEWWKTPTVRQRQQVRKLLESSVADDAFPVDARILDEMVDATYSYDPRFIVTDETVARACAMYRTERYQAVLCNYTHLVGVLEELQLIAPLPPTVIFTHDALSRLDRKHAGERIDTAYRYCPPAMEAAALNAVAGTVKVAITDSEKAYFERIGVHGPIVVCEHNAHDDAQHYKISVGNFAKRRLIFHGSSNRMNQHSLSWFVTRCWPAIRMAVPDATLEVCGKICSVWHAAPGQGIELSGLLDYPALMQRLQGASIAVNPTLFGTGLKIKTVEAVCLGLPSVCLPEAASGLEDVIDRVGVLANDEHAFAAACIRLLTDFDDWRDRHRGALQVAAERFSANAVFGALDAVMGWQEGAVARREAPRPPAEHSCLDARMRPLIPTAKGLRRLKAMAEIVEDSCLDEPGPQGHYMAAHCALALDNPSHALMHAAILIEHLPLDPAGYVLASRTLASRNIVNAARDMAQKALAVAPADSTLAAALPPFDDPSWAELVGALSVFNPIVDLDPARGLDPGALLAWPGWTDNLGSGAETPAGTIAWRLGRLARLRLQAPPVGALDQALELVLWLPAKGYAAAFSLDLRLDGQLLLQREVGAGDTWQHLVVPWPHDLPTDRSLRVLDLRLEGPAAPRALGLERLQLVQAGPSRNTARGPLQHSAVAERAY